MTKKRKKKLTHKNKIRNAKHYFYFIRLFAHYSPKLVLFSFNSYLDLYFFASFSIPQFAILVFQLWNQQETDGVRRIVFRLIVNILYEILHDEIMTGAGEYVRIQSYSFEWSSSIRWRSDITGTDAIDCVWTVLFLR